MTRILNQNQIDHYREFGFIACVDVMSEDETCAYKEKLELAEQRYPQHIGPEKRNNAHLCFTFLDEIAHHPRILGAVEDLIGQHFSLWASVLFVKEPNSPHFVSWHQDATYMGMSSNEFVTPWLALTPSNRETGCMSMIPGSHKQHIRQHTDTYGENNILTRGQEVAEVNEKEAVDIILRPGQMSLHHAQTIHGSQPNKSDQRRIGFALQSYMPPNVVQQIGKNYWLDIQGDNLRGPDSISLPRPGVDAANGSVTIREQVDENLAEILYNGAKIRRAY